MMFIDELEQFNLFLKEYAAYLALGGVLIILLTVLAIFWSGKKTHKPEDFSPLILALGGKENILLAEARGSRISVKLLDDTKLRLDDFPKELVSSYIKMTGKIVLVVGKQSESIVRAINKKTA